MNFPKVGESGSGKTTTGLCTLHLTKSNEGVIRLEGYDVRDVMQPGITEPPDLYLLNYRSINLEIFNSCVRPEIIKNIG